MKNLVKISLVLAAAALTLSGCNCFKKMGKKQDEVTYSCTPKVLTLNNGVVSADITVNFPAAYFNKKATLRLTPVIVFEGGEVAGTPKYVQGEKVNDNYTVISADNGGTYTQHVEFPYDDRMEQSELRVLIESKCNGASEYVMFNAATGKPVTKEEAAVLANPKSAEAMALRAQCGVFIAEGVNTMQKDFNFGDAAATSAKRSPRIGGICPPCGASAARCAASCRAVRRGAAVRAPPRGASPVRSWRRRCGRCRPPSPRR